MPSSVQSILDRGQSQRWSIGDVVRISYATREWRHCLNPTVLRRIGGTSSWSPVNTKIMHTPILTYTIHLQSNFTMTWPCIVQVAKRRFWLAIKYIQEPQIAPPCSHAQMLPMCFVVLAFALFIYIRLVYSTYLREQMLPSRDFYPPSAKAHSPGRHNRYRYTPNASSEYME
jgi:hypothetical protein